MKRIFMLGLGLLLLGAALFLGGYYASGENLAVLNGDLGPVSVRVGSGGFGERGRDRDGDAAVRTAVYDPSELSRVELKEDNAAVTVGTSPDGKIHLRWLESEDDPLEIAVEDGLLRAERKTRLRIFLWIFEDVWSGEEGQPTELLLPAGLALSVESDNGSITVEGAEPDSLALKSDNGRVTVRKVTCAAASARTDNGTIEAEDLNCASLEAKTSNGKVILTRVTSDGAVGAVNSNGSVQAEDMTCAGLTVQTSNGKVTLTRTVAGVLSVRSSNGSIQLAEAAARERIELHSGNGGIRGTLAGKAADYTIRSTTGNGSSNLPQEAGGGPVLLEVQTGNGSIDLRFAGEE